MLPGSPITITSESLNHSRGCAPETRPAIPDHELIRCIGQGAYGEVWLGRNILKAYRAIKIVYRKSFRDEHTYTREFRGIQQFEPISRTNESLLDILQVGRDDSTGHYYYVMELADDRSEISKEPTKNDNWENYEPKTLATVLRERGRLSPRECVELGLNLTMGIGHLHCGGLIHRDIKPTNIIFVRGIPKLADIGLVTTFDGTCSFVGTEGFIAPEGPTSPRADIFSLGKVLYEISTGKDRKDFPEPATGLGERSDGQEMTELNAVILKACAIDPKDRYQSAEEFHAELAVLHSGRSVKWRRKVEHRLATARKAGVVVGLVAVLATGAYLYERHQTREAKRLHELAEGLATQMQIQNAEHLLEKGDSALGVAHLAQVLRRHPQNRVAAERIMAVLTQRNFPRQAIQPLVHQAKLIAARFSPDGERIATASADHSIHIWDVKTGNESTLPVRLTAWINSIEFSPDGSKLAVASDDGTTLLLDVRTGALLFPPFKHDSAALAVKFDPSGLWIATGWGDSSVRAFSVATGELFGAVLEHESPVKSLDFSPDGRWLATLSEEGSVRIWEFSSGQQKKHFQNDNSFGITVRFNGNGERVAAAFNAVDAWQVKIWDVDSGQPLSEPLTHQNRIYTVAFSPDNQRLMTADADNFANVWNIDTGTVLFKVQHSAIVYSAAFSPDGQKILTASVDHTAKLWNASTGAPISEPLLHRGRVIHAEFSPSGEQVLTASWDKSARIWNVRPVITPSQTLHHSFWVVFAEFDHTGERAITATKGEVFTANDINISWTGQQHATVLWQTKPLLSQVAPVLPNGLQTLAAQFTGAGAKALVNRTFGRQARIWDMDAGIESPRARLSNTPIKSPPRASALMDRYLPQARRTAPSPSGMLGMESHFCPRSITRVR